MRLLINVVFAPPVGHMIEALHYACGHHRASRIPSIDRVLPVRSRRSPGNRGTTFCMPDVERPQRKSSDRPRGER